MRSNNWKWKKYIKYECFPKYTRSNEQSFDFKTSTPNITVTTKVNNASALLPFAFGNIINKAKMEITFNLVKLFSTNWLKFLVPALISLTSIPPIKNGKQLYSFRFK